MLKVENRRLVWLCLGKPSFWENLLACDKDGRCKRMFEAILGSDREARLCFKYFQIWGMIFSFFLGRMSGDKLSKGIVLICIHLIVSFRYC